MRDGENWGLLITTIVQLPIRPHWQPRHHIHAPFLVRCRIHQRGQKVFFF